MKSDLHINTNAFGELLNKQEDFNTVFEVVYTTIMGSFQVVDAAALGKQAVISQEEIKRRFDICERWFRVMRADLGYSLSHTLAAIPVALVCELTDQEFKPDDPEASYAYTSTAEALSRIIIED